MSDVGPVFAALADPTRRALLETLAARPESTATSLAADLPISRQAVAKHLHVLSSAELVRAAHVGRETRYTIATAPMTDAVAWIGRVGAESDGRLRRLQSLLAH